MKVKEQARNGLLSVLLSEFFGIYPKSIENSGRLCYHSSVTINTHMFAGDGAGSCID